MSTSTKRKRVTTGARAPVGSGRNPVPPRHGVACVLPCRGPGANLVPRGGAVLGARRAEAGTRGLMYTFCYRPMGRRSTPSQWPASARAVRRSARSRGPPPRGSGAQSATARRRSVTRSSEGLGAGGAMAGDGVSRSWTSCRGVEASSVGRSLPVLPELKGLDSDRGGLAGHRARRAARDSSPR
jgi:hypothetical protein